MGDNKRVVATCAFAAIGLLVSACSDGSAGAGTELSADQTTGSVVSAEAEPADQVPATPADVNVQLDEGPTGPADTTTTGESTGPGGATSSTSAPGGNGATARPPSSATSTTRPVTAGTATTRPTTGPTTSAGSDTRPPTTAAPTTRPPTTAAPTTRPPTTAAPTTRPPTTAAPAPSGQCGGRGDFTRVLYDDFNGSSLSGNWRVINGTGNAKNGQVFGVRRPDAVRLNNGWLEISAWMENGQVVSGLAETTFGQKYGYYEFRVRSVNNDDMSGVVLTWPEVDLANTEKNPYGENNIYETLAKNFHGLTDREASVFRGYVHKPDLSSQQTYVVYPASPNDAHVVAMEWTPDDVNYYLDGRHIVEESWSDKAEDGYSPQVPHVFVIQLDAFAHQIQGQAKLMVDYVEICGYRG